jgi:hypothetical protein
VFNYIDAVYGVAREVQCRDGIDCFYDDDKIYPFLVRSWQVIERRRGLFKAFARKQRMIYEKVFLHG